MAGEDRRAILGGGAGPVAHKRPGAGLVGGDRRRAGTWMSGPRAGRLPEFWVFSVWRFPQFGATYNELTVEQRNSVGDHWGRLGRLVRRFFSSTFVPPT